MRTNNRIFGLAGLFLALVGMLCGCSKNVVETEEGQKKVQFRVVNYLQYTFEERELELLLMSGLPKYLNTWHLASLMQPQTNSWEQYRCKTRRVRAMEPSALRFLTASTDWFSLATVAIRH